MEHIVAIAVLVCVAVVVVLLWVIFRSKWARPTSPKYLLLRRHRGKPRIVKIVGSRNGKVILRGIARNGGVYWMMRTPATIEHLKIATVH